MSPADRHYWNHLWRRHQPGGVVGPFRLFFSQLATGLRQSPPPPYSCSVAVGVFEDRHWRLCWARLHVSASACPYSHPPAYPYSPTCHPAYLPMPMLASIKSKYYLFIYYLVFICYLLIYLFAIDLFLIVMFLLCMMTDYMIIHYYW